MSSQERDGWISFLNNNLKKCTECSLYPVVDSGIFREKEVTYITQCPQCLKIIPEEWLQNHKSEYDYEENF